MTLVQLRHLIELAGNSSFSQSAIKLHITQPALSRSIRALEDELSQTLFDRIGRKNELTEFGVHIVQRARVLVDEANELRLTKVQLQKGDIGQFRIGLGSGPGAMLMTPLMMLIATKYPRAHIDISRGNTALLVQALRDRLLDALILDIRSLQPAVDLRVEAIHEMVGAFMCRPKHPLSQKDNVTFAMLQDYPIASTPLSEEVARILIEQYGPQAHPDNLVNLRSEEISSLLDVVRKSNAVVLTIRATAPDLIELPISPPMSTKARFGLVTIASRTEPLFLHEVRTMMHAILKDVKTPASGRLPKIRS